EVRPNLGPGSEAAAPTIAYLGRLVPHKRVELLLEAAAILVREFPDLRVRIMGRGPCGAELEARSARLGLDRTVSFEGFVDEATKARMLGDAWVLGLPSAREGWGIAVMEAAAFETPTVAFRVGGLEESVVDGRTGLLASSFD